MESHFISYRNSRIHYFSSGTGEKLILCFHGFAESAESFLPLFPYAAQNRTIIAFDLPHHGLTEWNDDHNFSVADLKNILENCPEIHKKNFDLVGYSMGGRVSLAMLEFMPERINHVVLLAPDGIKVNFWYWLATQTSAGNKLFGYTMQHPQWFAGLLRIFGKLGFANESIARFVNRFLDDKEMRQRIFTVWTTMRKFKANLKTLKKQIMHYRRPVRLIYGKYDRIIRYQNAQKLTGGIEEYCKVIVLESGHQLLQEKNATEIMDALSK